MVNIIMFESESYGISALDLDIWSKLLDHLNGRPYGVFVRKWQHVHNGRI